MVLRGLRLQEGALLQYVDDIILASRSKEKDKNRVTTLIFFFFSLATRLYKVSKKKVKISQSSVNYLAFELTKEQRNLLPDHQEAMASVAIPATRRQLWGFLGTA